MNTRRCCTSSARLGPHTFAEQELVRQHFSGVLRHRHQQSGTPAASAAPPRRPRVTRRAVMSICRSPHANAGAAPPPGPCAAWRNATWIRANSSPVLNGFVEIVVCAVLQRHDLLLFLVTHAEDDDRRPEPFAQPHQHVLPVHVGQPQVQAAPDRADARPPAGAPRRRWPPRSTGSRTAQGIRARNRRIGASSSTSITSGGVWGPTLTRFCSLACRCAANDRFYARRDAIPHDPELAAPTASPDSNVLPASRD